MKKLSLLLLLFCGILRFHAQSPIVRVSDTTNGFLIHFQMPNYTLKDTVLSTFFSTSETFSYFESEELGIVADVGYPLLPQHSLDLPLYASSNILSVEVREERTQVLSLTHRIVPCQEDFVNTGSFPLPFSIQTDYYASDGRSREELFAYSDPYIVFGQKGVTLSIFPFTYRPTQGQVSVLQEAVFYVKYSPPSKTSSIENSSEVKASYLENFFDRSFAQALPSKSSALYKGRYLIVCDPIYEHHLDSFLLHKQSLGYSVDLKTTAECGNTAAGIKNLINSRYHSFSTRPDFVVLVGDTKQIPPTSGDTSGLSISDPVTDFGYSQLDGDDFYADVMLGRFPCKSANELQTMLQKSIYMETNAPFLPKNAVFVSGTDDRLIMQYTFKAAHKDVIRDAFQPAGYTCNLLLQPNINTLRNALNNNPLFFIYSGHGNTEAMVISNNTIINETFVDLGSNNSFPIVFSFACLTNNYGITEFLGHNFLRSSKGGVAYFGSSVNSNNLIDNKIERYILRDEFQRSPYLGQMILLAKNTYRKSYFNRFFYKTERYIKAYNLLGDPALCLVHFPEIVGIDLLSSTCTTDYHLARMHPALENGYWRTGPGLDIVEDRGKNGVRVQRAQEQHFQTSLQFHFTANGKNQFLSKNVKPRIRPTFFIVDAQTQLAQEITGLETRKSYYFRSTNYSPDILQYRWVLLRPNSGSPDAMQIGSAPTLLPPIPFGELYSGRETSDQATNFSTEGIHTLYLRILDGCGWSQLQESFYVRLGFGAFEIGIFPNPASEVLTVDFEQTTENTRESTFGLKVFDPSGQEKYNRPIQLSSSNRKVQIPTSQWKEGTYYLHIENQGKTLQRQIYIKR